jgi:hypothetical protein
MFRSVVMDNSESCYGPVVYNWSSVPRTAAYIFITWKWRSLWQFTLFRQFLMENVGYLFATMHVIVLS